MINTAEKKDNMISIIIPAYNIQEYIGKTLDNVLRQTYTNIEIIVVDDGSTDSTGKIIDDYENRFPDKIRGIHISNGGVTNARLKGVLCSKGEWIGFVDGDDFIDEDMYSFLINNAIKYSADISHCGYKLVLSDGRVHYFHNSGVILEQNKKDALEYLLDGSLVEPGLCNKLYRKTLFDDFFRENLMDCSIKQNEDLLMNFILFNYSKKSIYNDVCKYHYMERKGSATRTKLNDNIVYDPIRVRELILEMADKEIRQSAEKMYISTCIDVYNFLVVSNDKKYAGALRQIGERIKTHKEWMKLLNKKRKLLAILIISVPQIYKILYRIYADFFQEKRYE